MVKTKIKKECKRMSPKRKHKKKDRKDKSSDIHVEDKQYEKKKHRKDESSDIHVEDKQYEKKKHRRDETSDIRYKDKSFKKKKDRKDESSDIHVEDTKFKKQNIDYNQQAEFVYYDPSIIQAVDVFQYLAEHSAVSLQNDDVEAVDHVVDVDEQEVEAIDRDGMNE
jgi:hypothetical protein